MFFPSFFSAILFVLPFFTVISKNQALFYIGYAFLVTFLFVLVWLRDPGFLKKKGGMTVLRLLTQTEPYNICPDCEIVKPERSRHCEACNHCVMVYDHHCPWINNCVGARNHKQFLVFITLLWGFLIYHTFVAIASLNIVDPDNTLVPNILDLEDSDYLFARSVTSLVTAALSTSFALPMAFLLCVQLQNFLQNRTTSERFGQAQKRRSPSALVGRNHSGDHSSRSTCGFLSNCRAMCCSNAEDSRFNYVSL
eukprot:TRINITY_DN4228_c0_g1_i5.p1 TRINITY_DN4228_c0_g1~~TRINITY_DN4228_c0_g1_i5.p1  ORF type:complete len:252 (-),score=11.54 TRINITY_DN4228_c0_g1_i5:45-800(-)